MCIPAVRERHVCVCNPGLFPLESIGNGMEYLLRHPAAPGMDIPPVGLDNCFGSFNTLTVVSLITAALRQLQTEGEVLLVGYNGIMLPVMEDLVLADRAAGSVWDVMRPDLPAISHPRGTYTLRDLLVFSTVCGVGLDTVPIPGRLPGHGDIYMCV